MQPRPPGLRRALVVAAAAVLPLTAIPATAIPAAASAEAASAPEAGPTSPGSPGKEGGLSAQYPGAGPSDVGGSPDRSGFTIVRPEPTQRDWSPLHPDKWSFSDRQVIQAERGDPPEGPRRPFEYAIVDAGPELGSVRYRATVRIDEPVTRNDRDVVLIFNYRSPTSFYYVHLSQDNTIYPHNGIFKVDDADRERIDDQWNGESGARPAIDDREWHDVRVDHHAPSGRIAVHIDGSPKPLMTAKDTTFSGGRIGFGSFDNYGRIRDVTAVGIRD
ncbi:hypothetical protein FB384_002143 [Prauserella sediminis]|uniref:Concanavalin A-like lectin/glucanase superfamily protein n=1 Tax=Prauserella sediminis TaxID=577680 RepID=A0A839XMZ5_9PSEU|nr:hypothetical protein [Prauserella sediminis]MBB3663239.1 hypothetical protein [Prauserella sediminis]